MRLSSKYCIAGLLALCETEIKPFVDTDNVPTIFRIALTCQAQQLMAFCSFFARKHQSRLRERVCKDNAEDMNVLGLRSRVPALCAECTQFLEPEPPPLPAPPGGMGGGETKESHEDAVWEPMLDGILDRRCGDDLPFMTPGAGSMMTHYPPRSPSDGDDEPSSRERMWSA